MAHTSTGCWLVEVSCASLGLTSKVLYKKKKAISVSNYYFKEMQFGLCHQNTIAYFRDHFNGNEIIGGAEKMRSLL